MTRLRKIRIRKNLSVKEASKMIGISSPYLSQLETGERQIGRNTLDKICRAYNCKPNDILDYDDSFILIDETSNEFSQQDIEMMRLIKQMSNSDKDEMYNFLSYLIWKHNQRIEEMQNGKKGN